MGAYLTFQLHTRSGVPFVLAVLIAAAACAVLSLALERAIIRRIPTDNHFAAIMITVGALFAAQAVFSSVWGPDPLTLGDPWGVRTVDLGGVTLAVSALWTIGISLTLLAAFFAVLNYTRVGLAIRTMVSDPLAASANGVHLGRVKLMVWGAAGAAGGVAGVLLATGSQGVNISLGIASFAALPAMVLGGLASPLGAIIGGLVIGLVQQFAAYFVATQFTVLGGNFAAVTPYIILIIVLAVKPAGIFGAANVHRF
jgi:branched-chain amino acid transport system permease protein